MVKESQNIEYKQTWHDDYLKWICGFANAQGGHIYIGKDDNGKLVGLNNAKKLLEDLPNKIRDQLGLMPDINLHKKDENDYLEIIVQPSTVPISFRGSYYWRSGSVKQELKGHALTEFLLKKMGKSWDTEIESQATLEDIDEITIELFKKKALASGRLPDFSSLSTKELLKKLHLLTEKGLTRAAIILFGKDPGDFYTNTFLKIGRFGLSVVDMRFQEVCEGNLFKILHDALEQLEKKFLIKPIRFEGFSRIEELEYPVPALREMLLNALVHRSYVGSMTQLKVMDDRLTLWNAGVLPIELTIEKLFTVHESYPRNPLIADICYKAGYIDSWGRGVKKIIDACTLANLPEPIIFERNGGFVVELLKSESLEQLGNQAETQVKTTELKEPFSEQFRNNFGIISERIRKECGSEAIKAFEIIYQHPEYSAEQIAAILGKTSRTIENYIAKLKKSGFILRKGPKKGGHWEVNI